jgi:hypothetical protein
MFDVTSKSTELISILLLNKHADVNGVYWHVTYPFKTFKVDSNIILGTQYQF